MNLIEQGGGSIALSLPVLAQGTNAGTFQHTATLNFSVDGVIFTKGATNNVALNQGAPVAHLTQAAGTQCLYAIDIDSAGSYYVTQGKIETTANINAGAVKLQLPEQNIATRCRFGIIRIVNATNPFISGTTALNATGVTATYFNVLMQPVNLALFS